MAIALTCLHLCAAICLSCVLLSSSQTWVSSLAYPNLLGTKGYVVVVVVVVDVYCLVLPKHKFTMCLCSILEFYLVDGSCLFSRPGLQFHKQLFLYVSLLHGIGVLYTRW
jgi:hypothetical protein